ncbi:MAG TPA: PEGA domain-containing protein [Thermotogota bacterium]|nr:PEGA domain-containing protein [Thermotogota bacterium]HRW92058.1 PEGA domain-containing protein [Thermotogota bacterium]
MKRRFVFLLLSALLVFSVFAANGELEPRKIIIVPEEPASFEVYIDLNKPQGSVYQPGEIISMTVRTTRDAYVVIYDTDPTGSTYVLFPNQYQPDNFVRANQPVKIPYGYKMKVGEDRGKEYLQVVASTQQFTAYDSWSRGFSTNPYPFVTSNSEMELKPYIQRIIIEPGDSQPQWTSTMTFFYVGMQPPTNGTVEFVTNPSGAQVMIDGNWTGQTTPFKTVLTAGNHFVRFYKSGYQAVEKDFYLSPGSYIQVTGQLQPLVQYANATIYSSPSGATVLLDGVQQGVTPLTIQSIVPGYHTIRIQKDGYQPKEQSVQFAPGESKTINAALNPLVINGTLQVFVQPADSQILLDGINYGTANGQMTLVVQPGNHTLQVQKNGYAQFSQDFYVQSGEAKVFNVTLQPLAGKFSVRSSPSGADIFINGSSTGETTSETFEMSPGVYQLTLKKSGYQDWTTTVTVQSGDNPTIEAQLQPLIGQVFITPNVYVQLYVDGERKTSISSMKTYTLDLSPGMHEIVLLGEGYFAYVSRIYVEAGKSYSMNATLEPIS